MSQQDFNNAAIPATVVLQKVPLPLPYVEPATAWKSLTPIAATSGLILPSDVGPRLLKLATRLLEVTAPTVIIFKASAGETIPPFPFPQ